MTSQAPPTTPTPPPMGKSAFRGSFWMLFNALATRVASLAATVLLGLWLTKGDFGVYGIAMSMAALTAVLREGGVRQYLIREHRRHDELVGPVFHMALAFNLLTAAVLAGMAQFTHLWTDDPREAATVAKVLYVIAITQPLNTPGAVLQAKLMGSMQFGVVSAVNGVSSLIRFGGAILLAWLFARELGALAFVLSLPACALFEWGFCLWFNRERLWRRSPEFGTWWTMLSHTGWILLGSLAIALMNWGSNLALSATSRSTELVGVYFMAYNIVVQVGILLSANVGQVLMPAFARFTAEPERLRNAILKAIRQMMLLGAPLSLGLAVTFPALETLLWHGKWEHAGAAVRVLGYTYPFSVALAVPLAAQQAVGHFRQYALGLVVVGVVTVGAAGLGGVLYRGDPGAAEKIAWLTGGSGAMMSLLYLLVICRRRGIGVGAALAAALPSWAIVMACAVPVILFDARVLADAPALVRLLASGGVFTLLFALASRLLIPSHLDEALAAAPSRMARPARRALLLPEPAA